MSVRHEVRADIGVGKALGRELFEAEVPRWLPHCTGSPLPTLGFFPHQRVNGVRDSPSNDAPVPAPTLSTQQVAERLGLTAADLHHLRLRDGGLPIAQRGLQVYYRLEDVQAFERREVAALLEQLLNVERPLPLVRAIANLAGLAAQGRSRPPASDISPVTEAVTGTASATNAPAVSTATIKPTATRISTTSHTPLPAAAPAPEAALPASLLAPRPAPGPALPAPPLGVLPVPAAALPSLEPALPAPDATLPDHHAAPTTLGWYLVHTKPRQEDVAIANLERQRYECYMPMLTLEKRRRGKKVLVDQPLFPSYVFVRLDSSESGQSWAPIRSTIGVRQLVRFGAQAAKVDARLIDTLRAREAAQRQHPERLFKTGERVVIVDGPFAGIEAVYQMDDAEQRCMVLLEILSKPVPMRIDATSLRKAS